MLWPLSAFLGFFILFFRLSSPFVELGGSRSGSPSFTLPHMPRKESMPRKERPLLLGPNPVLCSRSHVSLLPPFSSPGKVKIPKVKFFAWQIFHGRVNNLYDSEALVLPHRGAFYVSKHRGILIISFGSAIFRLFGIPC